MYDNRKTLEDYNKIALAIGFAPRTDLENLNWTFLMQAYYIVTEKYDIAWKITSKGTEIHNHNNGINIKCEDNSPIDAFRDAFCAMTILAGILNKKEN